MVVFQFVGMQGVGRCVAALLGASFFTGRCTAPQCTTTAGPTWRLRDAVARLVHGDAAAVAADQLVGVVVHIAVAHAAAVARPAHGDGAEHGRPQQHIQPRLR